MSKIQIIRGEDGEELFALVPMARFKAMAEALEELADIAAFDKAEVEIAAGEPLIPWEMSKRLTAGENPVRVWRRHRGLKVTELAQRAGISQPYLSAIEGGKQPGSVAVLRRLAAALETDVDSLLREVGDQGRSGGGS